MKVFPISEIIIGKVMHSFKNLRYLKDRPSFVVKSVVMKNIVIIIITISYVVYAFPSSKVQRRCPSLRSDISSLPMGDLSERKPLTSEDDAFREIPN